MKKQAESSTTRIWRALALLVFTALLASVFGAVPAQAQEDSTITVTSTTPSVRVGGKALFAIDLSPPAAEQLSVEVRIVRTGGPGSLADVLDLTSSGILPGDIADGAPSGARRVIVPAGATTVNFTLKVRTDAVGTGFQAFLTDTPDPYRPSGPPARVQIARAVTPVGPPLTDVLPEGVVVGAAAGAAAVTTVDEGGTLQFGVFLAEPAPFPVTATVNLNFRAASNIDAASPADLTEGGRTIAVAIPAGAAAVPVQIQTALDEVVPEGDALGLERFQVQVVSIENAATAQPIRLSADAIGAPLTLAIRDVESVGRTITAEPEATEEPERVRRPGRTRPFRLLPPEVPTPDPVQGPLVAGAIRADLDGRLVTVTIPSALQAWLAPNSAVRVLIDGISVGSGTGAPDSMIVDLSDRSGRPEMLVFQGRLRNGAVYNETISISAES